MDARSLLWLVTLCGLAGSPGILADDNRARQNYMIHCMGCHGEEGDGFKDQVPSMRGTLARLAAFPEGRSYLLRVPGVSQSSLDAQLTAEVLNWTLREFSDAEILHAVAPLTADEVTEARTRPLLEVASARARLLRSEELAQ